MPPVHKRLHIHLDTTQPEASNSGNGLGSNLGYSFFSLAPHHETAVYLLEAKRYYPLE
jgi:hypothetical protein